MKTFFLAAYAFESIVESGHDQAAIAGAAVLTAGVVIVVSLIVWAVIRKFANETGFGERHEYSPHDPSDNYGRDCIGHTWDVNREMHFPIEAEKGEVFYSPEGRMMEYDGDRWRDRGRKRWEHPSVGWTSND